MRGRREKEEEEEDIPFGKLVFNGAARARVGNSFGLSDRGREEDTEKRRLNGGRWRAEFRQETAATERAEGH